MSKTKKLVLSPSILEAYGDAICNWWVCDSESLDKVKLVDISTLEMQQLREWIDERFLVSFKIKKDYNGYAYIVFYPQEVIPKTIKTVKEKPLYTAILQLMDRVNSTLDGKLSIRFDTENSGEIRYHKDWTVDHWSSFRNLREALAILINYRKRELKYLELGQH